MVKAYITNGGTNTVSIIDTDSNTVISTITVGNNPYGVAVTPDASAVWITRSGGVKVYSTITGNEASFSPISLTGVLGGVAISPDGSMAFVANNATGKVHIYNTATGAELSYSPVVVGGGPNGIAVTPDGTKVFVANTSSGTVSAFNTSNGTSLSYSPVTVSTNPIGIAITPDGSKVFVTNSGLVSEVSVFNVSNGSPASFSPITAGNGPWGIVIHPNGTAYVSNFQDNTISVFDTSTGNAASYSPINLGSGKTPRGLSITSDGAHLYIANSGDNTVSVINIATHGITNSIAVGSGPVALGQFIQPASIPMTDSPGGFVNRFRNGTMDVAQRGTSGSVASGNTQLALDGWYVGATGAACVWDQVYSADANYFQLIGNTGMTDTFIKQRIESSVAAFLSNKNVTVQLIVSNTTGAAITPTLTVKHATARDNWGATVTDVNAISLQSVANNASATVAYTFTAANDTENGLEVTFDFGAALNSNAKSVYLTYADIRATPGVATGLNASPPTPELRPIAPELAFCQRYFNSTFGSGVTPAQNAGLSGALAAQPYGAAAGQLYTQWNFPVQMRVNPTITTYNPSAANANWRDKTNNTDIVVSVDPDSAIGRAGVMIGSQTTALTAGRRCYIHATASAEL